jgi:hypothetical protein|tara:strand:- start:5766 stop:6032 length:267 start_codon:yes stop_codon:yes gene_type:complete
MNISIEDHPNGLISDVKLIRINGIGAGYCGISEGSPICFTGRQTQAVQSLVKLEVEKFIGGTVGSINEPPPTELESEEIEDDDINNQD